MLLDVVVCSILLLLLTTRMVDPDIQQQLPGRREVPLYAISHVSKGLALPVANSSCPSALCRRNGVVVKGAVVLDTLST